jgi:signal recognition particle subunit SRP9
VLKYSHKKQALEIKVTDDRTCLKFRTDTADDLKRIDKLTTWFMRRMAADNPNTYQDAQDN